MANTPNRGYVYPATTSPATVPADLQAPLEQIDADVQEITDLVGGLDGRIDSIVGLNPDGTLPTPAQDQVSAMIDAQGMPSGTVPIFTTMAAALAWEAENPGRKALTTEPQEPDVDPPTAGTLAVSPTDITANLTVTGATDNRAVTGYSFKIGSGDWSTWQVGNTYTATGLNPDTAYTFQHRVRDGAGNTATGTAVQKTTAAMSAKTPAEIGALWGHWDASLNGSVTVEAGEVSTWTDLTSNARQLVQATPARRPAMSTIGGKAAVQCDRAQQDYMRYQSSFTLDPTVGYTMCWIGRWDDSDITASQGVARIAGGAGLVRRSPDGLILNAGVPIFDGPTSQKPAAGEVVFVAIKVKTGGPSTVYISGVSGPTNSGNGGTPGTALDLGRSDGSYASATTGEVWVHNRALSTAELDSLHMYAQQKWGAL